MPGFAVRSVCPGAALAMETSSISSYYRRLFLFSPRSPGSPQGPDSCLIPLFDRVGLARGRLKIRTQINHKRSQPLPLPQYQSTGRGQQPAASAGPTSWAPGPAPASTWQAIRVLKTWQRFKSREKPICPLLTGPWTRCFLEAIPARAPRCLSPHRPWGLQPPLLPCPQFPSSESWPGPSLAAPPGNWLGSRCQLCK